MNAHWMRFEPDVTRHYQDCCQGHFDALRLQWHFKFLELGKAAWPILWVITLDTIRFFHFATRLLLNLDFSSIVTMSMSILPFSLSLASESCSECQLFQSFEPLDCCQFNLESWGTQYSLIHMHQQSSNRPTWILFNSIIWWAFILTISNLLQGIHYICTSRIEWMHYLWRLIIEDWMVPEFSIWQNY